MLVNQFVEIVHINITVFAQEIHEAEDVGRFDHVVGEYPAADDVGIVFIMEYHDFGMQQEEVPGIPVSGVLLDVVLAHEQEDICPQRFNRCYLPALWLQ